MLKHSGILSEFELQRLEQPSKSGRRRTRRSCSFAPVIGCSKPRRSACSASRPKPARCAASAGLGLIRRAAGRPDRRRCRAAELREMDPDLVGPPGPELQRRGARRAPPAAAARAGSGSAPACRPRPPPCACGPSDGGRSARVDRARAAAAAAPDHRLVDARRSDGRLNCADRPTCARSFLATTMTPLTCPCPGGGRCPAAAPRRCPTGCPRNGPAAH